MTPRQQEYADFLEAFFKENDSFPTYAMIASEMGVNNFAVQGVMERLEKQGLIERNSVGGWRWAR